MKEAAESRLRLFPFFFHSLSRLFKKKKKDRSCDEHAGVHWAVKGLVTVATLLLFFPPFRYFLLYSLTQFEIVKQKEMKSLSPLTKPFKIILERPMIMTPLK